MPRETRTTTPVAASSAAIRTTAGSHPRRFGVMLYPDRDPAVIIARARELEAMGFDLVVLPDHMADFRAPGSPWLDSWTLLAAIAVSTATIRLGTLVSNPILRPPALLAKQALTVDHLSRGRLELGIGAGLFAADHAAVGSEPWVPRERAGRLAEYVEIVDGVLCGSGAPYTFAGEWLRATAVDTAPASTQQPRPPITVGGQSPSVLRTVARFAQSWNTIGPMGASAEEILAATARQTRQLDELAAEAGRDPAAIRRSFAPFGPWDFWHQPVSLAEIVERFGAIGMSEFLFDWPADGRSDELRRLAADTIPGLRAA